MNCNWKTNANVSVVESADVCYPSKPPFHPPHRFPELTFLPEFECDPENAVYTAVRDILARMSGTQPSPQWNPLADIIRPGDTVVLKPNFIKEHHETKLDEWEQVITHGSVIRAVCDYVLLALKGTGRIIICDAPQTDSSFRKICEVTGVNAIHEWYDTWSPVKVELLDLRKEEWEAKDDVIIKRTHLSGDPQEYVAVNLGPNSEFAGISPKHGFYGADYETDITARHHHGDVHEYLLSGTVMRADVVVNLPKLKTHKKTGITCSIKNFVGINGDKNWLPHYMLGCPDDGGDQFPEGTLKTNTERVLMTWCKRQLYRAPAWVNHIFRPIKKIGKLIFGDTHTVVRSGNWHGNDTTWRMAADLNKCFFYWHNDLINESYVRRYITIVDGIIAGEGEGPLAPDAKPCGVLIGGCNPVAVDAACAWLMGFDCHKLRMLTGTFGSKHLPLAEFTLKDVAIDSNNTAWQGTLAELDQKSAFSFVPHFGWVGAVERSS
jgi:uncharacterized protein (DUF362 family)